MDDPRDEQFKKDDLQHDDLVEEAAEENTDSLSEGDHQPSDENAMESEVESPNEEQVNRQIASAGLTVDVDESEETEEAEELQGADQGFTPEPLFQESETHKLRDQWLDVQSSFVDSPPASLEAADRFIDQVLDGIRSNLSQRCSDLREEWSNGNGSTTTEDLRQVLRHYRSMLDRLLEIEV